jgi:RNA polymerase sigma factor (sigma-70 family)
VPGSSESGPLGFPATHHSLIEALGATDPSVRLPAYDALISVYWKPVYKYLRVARRFGHEDAEDLTQDFFARAVERETLATFDPSKARFRTFLRVCLDRFAVNAIKAAHRLKRGGGRQPASLDLALVEEAIAREPPGGALDPEQYFRREWIRALFEGALDALARDYQARGKATQLAVFMAYDVDAPERPRYEDLADRYQVPVTQITNYLAAARRAFRKAVLDRLRAVSGSDAEFAAEARELLGVEE